MLEMFKVTMYHYTCTLCKATFMSPKRMKTGSCPNCNVITYTKDKEKGKTSI